MSYLIRIKRCDNRLLIVLNDATIYDQYYDQNPPLNDIVDITTRLQPNPYVNRISVRGFNGPTPSTAYNPWDFHYVIENGPAIVIEVHESSSGQTEKPNTWVLTRSHDIVLPALELENGVRA